MNTLKDLENAMFSNACPCNPIPFANGLIEGTWENGTDWIKSDQAKKILYTLIVQSYGQVFTIECLTEYIRLNKLQR